MIYIENLSKRYGQNVVLHIAGLEIAEGECSGWVGNNGAGKTTLFSLLLDLIQPTTGHVTSDGIKVSQSEDRKHFTSAFLDESFLIGYLTPTEYFKFIADLRGVSPTDLEVFLHPFAPFFNDEVLDNSKYIRYLSKGNQKKVGIAGAFIGSPKVVILDEPFANLDPTTQIRLKNLLKDLAKQKNTTMLISQPRFATYR